MLKNYFKVAIKVLLRRKFFTFISLFGISFTLVVLVVATALVENTFGPRAPETHADRTLGIFGASISGETSEGSIRNTGLAGYRLLDTYARNLPGVENMSIFTSDFEAATFHNGEQVRLRMKHTDAEFWRILDFTFVEGGPFTASDEKQANRVAVINESTRLRFFGGGPATGKSIPIDGREFQVVGVVQNVPRYRIVPFADVWAPVTTAKSDSYRKELVGGFMAILLARDKAEFPAIRREWQARLKQVEFSDNRFDTIESAAGTFFEHTASQILGDEGSSAKLLAVIGFLMFLFMLLPAINLMNINVSRILERSSEIGVRKAFGASSWTLVGQFLVENVAVTLVGGLIGFLLSIAVLRAISTSGLIAYADYSLNYRVFLLGLGLAVFFGVISGVYPAWRMSRLDPVQALKGGLR